MWYLFATSFVILSIFCSSFGSLLIKTTSSIQSRHPIGSFAQSIMWPIYSLIVSLFMSSISRPYWITDSALPCLMLYFMLLLHVLPCLVFKVAFSLLLNYFTNFHVGRSVPSLCMTYKMASSHVLS